MIRTLHFAESVEKVTNKYLGYDRYGALTRGEQIRYLGRLQVEMARAEYSGSRGLVGFGSYCPLHPGSARLYEKGFQRSSLFSTQTTFIRGRLLYNLHCTLATFPDADILWLHHLL